MQTSDDILAGNTDVTHIDKFFNPSSVVVIGASNTKYNLGATICKTLKEIIPYKGEVYAVNRVGEDVCGAKGFKKLHDIPDRIDLAMIITPASVVPDFVLECGQKGIQNVIIQSSGFSEKGEEGKQLQNKITEIARHYQIRILGPNCLGVMDTHRQFCAMWGANEVAAQILSHPGHISYFIQSGGLGEMVGDCLMEDVSGINKLACVGNKSDIDESDFIDYFDTDDTKVMALYLEDVKKGRKLMTAAKRTKKPVLVYKSGKSEAGSAAIMSHTASMAQNDAVFNGACKQAGIIRLESPEELYSMPKIFTEMPLLSGNRVAIFTNSGACGSIGADLLSDTDLVMAKFSDQTKSKLKQLPGVFNAGNPVDIGPAPPGIYLEIYDILLSSGEVDGLLHIVGIWREFVKDVMVELVKLCRHHNKPVALYSYNTAKKIISARLECNLPLFSTAREAVRALEVSHQQYKYLCYKEESLWKK